MLMQAVESYLDMRRSLGFRLKDAGFMLRSFARFSARKRKDYVCAKIAVDWAAQAPSNYQRARRLGVVARFARFVHLEDERNEIPQPDVFGSEVRGRRVPYILSPDDIRRLVEAASQIGRRIPMRRYTYGTLFGLLACTGLRVSEAIRLHINDLTKDGLIIRATKFRKSRLVPLHGSAQAALGAYLCRRRQIATSDDHLFISLRRRALLIGDVATAFRTAARAIGLTPGRKCGGPTPHSLRHSFAVRALESCRDGRDRVTKHMVALSTYLGHSNVTATYWYLEATPTLLQDIAKASEEFAKTK